MKNFIFHILKYSGLTFLVREIFQRNNVTILLYHDISSENAILHFSYLSKKYNIISLQDFISAHYNNEVDKLPKKSLIITLDDGHKNNYNLLPVVKKLNIPITIFLCSHIIGTNRSFWFKHKSLPIKKLKKISNKERLLFLEQEGYKQEMEYKDNRMSLSLNEIIEMSEFVDFQSHSMFHPCLPYCTKKEAEVEIEGSKKNLENLFNFKINSFAYPNGDYSDREIELLKKYNYLSGLSCDLWFNNQNTNIYKLKRLDCKDDASIIELEAKVTGLFIFLKRFFLGKDFGYMKNSSI